MRLILSIRAAISIAFAWYVAARHPHAASDLLRIFACYAAADAAVSVVQVAEMVGLGARSEYVGAALFGLVSRLCAALAIWFGPGIPYFAVTFVLYTGVLATLVLLSGIIELIEVGRSHSAPAALRTVLTIEGVATVVIALLAFVLTPVPATVQALMIGGGLIEAFGLLLIVAFGVVPAAGLPSQRRPAADE